MSELVTFVDPATSAALRVATGYSRDGTIHVWDADTGGALLVIDVRLECVRALAFFVDPATGAPRLVTDDGNSACHDPVAGGRSASRD